MARNLKTSVCPNLPRMLKKRPASKSKFTAHSIEAHALDTFGSVEKAEHWLNRPNLIFRGQSPRQAIQADPTAVEAELIRIDHGIFA
jgi:uncharacterized protein (DUF2384 family)